MSVTIFIPTALRQFAGGNTEFSCDALTVADALTFLTTTHADLRKHLYSDAAKLRSFVNVYVNDTDIRHSSGLETPIKDGDTVMIVPAIAGGVEVAEHLAEATHHHPVELSSAELARYSRHLILPEVGIDGQKKLKAARVLMIGTGGLGAPLGLYLAAAGVGRLGIVDFDVVDASNLQRQVIHGTKDVGRPKIASARDRLLDINPHIEVIPYETRLTSQNALELFRDYDVIVDGTDNFPTRYLVNDACVLLGKPNVYGSIFRFEGQATVFWAEKGACYRCLYPEPPPPGLVPSCAEGGVLGVLPGIVGSIQAAEVIKIILGAEDTLINRLIHFDAWRMRFKELKLRKDPNCPICGPNRTINALIDYEEFCGLKPPPAAPGSSPQAELAEITAVELKQRIDAGENLQIIDVREPYEYEIARLPYTKLIPLGQVVGRQSEIDPTQTTVVHCKMGGRSAKAIAQLKEAGFTGRLINLKGGITAWSTDVDPSVPKY
ncbi:MAG TPA: molybdopterin-synthase adenylyltransferase MoeB [Acidobacteriota bacterium]|nr:molybdopterin-synthase adenylyltransferase MoeB [Acidobacteriota bacterium]